MNGMAYTRLLLHHRQLSQELATDGITTAELDSLHATENLIIKAKQRRRPLLRCIEAVFWFFQLRINITLIRRLCPRFYHFLWDRVVSPVVNDWAGTILANDRRAATPSGIASKHCFSCKGPPGVSVIIAKDRLCHLICHSCANRFLLDGFLARDVQ